MTREAKTNDTADPELEMSSGLASGVRGELLSYQFYPVITLSRSMSRTPHLSSLKCKNVDKLVVLQQWHLVTCRGETLSQHLDSERVRERATPEESQQNRTVQTAARPEPAWSSQTTLYTTTITMPEINSNLVRWDKRYQNENKIFSHFCFRASSPVPIFHYSSGSS